MAAVGDHLDVAVVEHVLVERVRAGRVSVRSGVDLRMSYSFVFQNNSVHGLYVACTSIEVKRKLAWVLDAPRTKQSLLVFRAGPLHLFVVMSAKWYRKFVGRAYSHAALSGALLQMMRLAGDNDRRQAGDTEAFADRRLPVPGAGHQR